MEKQLNRASIHIGTHTSLPTYRQVNVVASLTRYASTRGIDRALLLSGSGIQDSDLDDPDFLITPEQELMVARNLIHRMPDPGLGLSIGDHYHAGVGNKLGIAAMNSNTFLEAIQLLFRFDDLLLTFFRYEVTADDKHAFLTLAELVDLKDVRLFMCEREFALIHRLACDLIGEPFPLKELHMAYPRPSHAARYQELFQCPLVFDAEYHMTVFDRSYLSLSLPMANPLTKKMYVNECVQLSQRLKRQGTITSKVRQEICFHTDGIPGFDRMARYLNISPSTLGRRLAVEGQTYKNLVSEIRKDKAIHLLETTTRSIEDIATDLGYSDISNFYRAFKRWTGQSPNKYRIKKPNQD